MKPDRFKIKEVENDAPIHSLVSGKSVAVITVHREGHI